jgi:hypothetical protein
MNQLLPQLRIDLPSSPVSLTGEERGPSAVALAKAYGIGEGMQSPLPSFASPHLPHCKGNGAPSSPVKETGEDILGDLSC